MLNQTRTTDEVYPVKFTRHVFSIQFLSIILYVSLWWDLYVLVWSSGKQHSNLHLNHIISCLLEKEPPWRIWLCISLHIEKREDNDVWKIFDHKISSVRAKSGYSIRTISKREKNALHKTLYSYQGYNRKHVFNVPHWEIDLKTKKL